MTSYAQIPTNLICRFGELSKTEIRVVCFLYASRNRKTGRCNPSYGAIGRAVGVAKTHIGSTVKSLDDKGWIFGEPDGNFLLCEEPLRVTESVTTGVTKSVTEGLPNRELKVTDLVTKGYEIGNSLIRISSEQKNEQKNEQSKREPTAADFGTPQNVPSKESLHSHPVIEALRIVTKRNPELAVRQYLVNKVGGEIDLAKLHITFAEWRSRGYSDKNFDGILDWYLGNKNGTSKPNYQKRTDADVLAESADFYENYPS